MHDTPGSARSTFVDLLRWRATYQPDRVSHVFADGDHRESLTYQQLWERASRIGPLLRRHGDVGDRVLLLYPPGLDFVTALFACLCSGVIAVPTYPGRRSDRMDRITAIVSDAQPVAVLTTTTTALPPALGSERAAAVITTDSRLDDVDLDVVPHSTDPRATALLQYTSGSTGVPKGVMVSHGNLMHNSAQIGTLFGLGAEDRGVLWLPLYHDMGLVGGVFQPLYSGFPMTLMSPISFVTSPSSWLRTISEMRATVSGGPNFAFDLCVDQVSPGQRDRLDLRSWRLAFTGAEPIRADTLSRFGAHFAQAGFDSSSFYPCYGLAEATLLAAGGSPTESAVVTTFDKDELDNGLVKPVVDDDAGPARRLVGCGRSPDDTTLLIVDPETGRPSDADFIGEIWLSGDSVAGGYWNRREQSSRVFGASLADGSGPFLRTGDLGFLYKGQLYVTGRISDLIIVRGRNFHPQDLEFSIEHAHPSLRSNCAAAFSIDVDDQERVVIAVEVNQPTPETLDTAGIAGAVRSAVARDCQLQIYDVVLLRSGTLPRTTSGKVRRDVCRRRYLDDNLAVVWRDAISHTTAGSSETSGPETRYPPLSELPESVRYLRHLLSAALRVGSGHVDEGKPLVEMGLDSLGAIQLRHRVETEFGAAPPLEDLLGGASLLDLAAWLESAAAKTIAGRSALPSAPNASADAHGLAAGQRAMWFLHRLHPDGAAYNVSCALRVTGELDTAALRAAFETLLKRHAILRTSYQRCAGAPRQQITDLDDGWFVIVDAGGWDEAVLRNAVSGSAHEPFDLERGPTLRVRVYTRGATDGIVLISGHHIAVDFRSIEIVLTELGMLYRPGVRGAPTLPDPTWVFDDYARWQRELLAGPDGQRMWEYWRRALTGPLPILQLPLDRRRPALRTYSGASRGFTLDDGRTRRLRGVASQGRVTLFTVLLTSFQVLLARYSRQSDIIIGVPLAARGRPELLDVVGHLVNTVPVRVDLSTGGTCSELLARTHRGVLEALAHQDFPFPLMVERSTEHRESDHSPIYQVAFTFYQSQSSGAANALAGSAANAPGLRGRIGMLEVESYAIQRRAAQFDLSLHIAETGAELVGEIVYNTDLFDAVTVDRMTEDLHGLLDSVASERVLSSLPMVSAPPFTAGPRLDTGLTPVHKQFEATAARVGANEALLDAHNVLTYGEVNAAANRLARRLRSHGVGRGSLVGVLLDSGPRQVIVILAILKAGAAYVPLDPSYPRDRLAYMMRDSAAALLVTATNHLAELHDVAVEVICVDAPGQTTEPSENLTVDVNAADLACVIYTSGSTGRPKAVMLSHGGLAGQIAALSDRLNITESTRHILVQSMAFAASLRQILAPLSSGGSVVIVQPRDAGDVRSLFDLISRLGVTVMSANPTFWRQCVTILDRMDPAARDELLDNRLRLLLSASEPLSADVPRWWYDTLGHRVGFVNMLGHTEASGIVTTFAIPTAAERTRSSVAVGAPLPGVEVHLLDESLQPVPVGVVGEMYLAGSGISFGYFNRPGLTSTRFLPHPHTPGERIYRTGDLGRLRENGTLEHCGRIDGQVKIRGFRVEPGEVEAAIEQHPWVHAAVVSASVAGDETVLVAHTVVDMDNAPTGSDLRGFLLDRLPQYLIPSVFVPISELPLNANGKVDRRALPSPPRERSRLDSEFRAASSPIEHSIVEIWQRVLEIETIGVDDSFFDLGGTSTSLSVVHHLLAAELGIDLAIAKLFQYPTVRALAIHLTSTGSDGAGHVEKGRSVGSRRRSMLENARTQRAR
ncbi:non-ribosomal peptide synthetase [Nocardia gipuzkoensis]|uniref:non-ribosomal peptide synthetase n=1 Tax=Nocardia gipuzkoensis TaxID=2749991 RepID=UPI002454960C|nr:MULTISPECIES: non-ribosomal peptide synthetase [Nocardia]